MCGWTSLNHMVQGLGIFCDFWHLNWFNFAAKLGLSLMTHHLMEMPQSNLIKFDLWCEPAIKSIHFRQDGLLKYIFFLSSSTTCLLNYKINSTSLCGNNKQCMISWLDEASAQIQRKEEESRIKDGKYPLCVFSPAFSDTCIFTTLYAMVIGHATMSFSSILSY